jgi:hypothetical protein
MEWQALIDLIGELLPGWEVKDQEVMARISHPNGAHFIMYGCRGAEENQMRAAARLAKVAADACPGGRVLFSLAGTHDAMEVSARVEGPPRPPEVLWEARTAVGEG